MSADLSTEERATARSNLTARVLGNGSPSHHRVTPLESVLFYIEFSLQDLISEPVESNKKLPTETLSYLAV